MEAASLGGTWKDSSSMCSSSGKTLGRSREDEGRFGLQHQEINDGYIMKPLCESHRAGLGQSLDVWRCLRCAWTSRAGEEQEAHIPSPLRPTHSFLLHLPHAPLSLPEQRDKWFAESCGLLEQTDSPQGTVARALRKAVAPTGHSLEGRTPPLGEGSDQTCRHPSAITV